VFWRKKKQEGPVRYGTIDARGLFHYRRPGGPPGVIDTFEADRKLRKFGEGEKWAEAVTILRTATLAEKSSNPKMAEEGSRQKRAAFDELASLARKVFDLQRAEEDAARGWTDSEAFVLFIDYLYAISEVQSEFLPLPKSLARPAV
jgi:hypothetical protein